MLITDFETDEEGMTVPYPAVFDDIRRNHGFVDLRGRPDLALGIFEGSESTALRGLLARLSESDSALFTLGCDLGTHEEPESDDTARCVAGGYIQLMSASYAECSPDDYSTFGWAIGQALEGRAQEHNWTVRFVLKLVVLSLDEFSGLTPSLWIWFDAAAHTLEAALVSREVLIGSLQDLLTDEHLTSVFRQEPDESEC